MEGKIKHMNDNTKMNKVVIIINGRGGVGKDTLCSFVGKKFKTRVVSAITPIKKLAVDIGWDGTKDARSRKLLSELKRVVVEYNDYPTGYLTEKYREFLASDETILFMHIREIDEIKKIREVIPEEICATLLVTKEDVGSWGNPSDDMVDQYEYEYYYDNTMPKDRSEVEFVRLIERILREKS